MERGRDIIPSTFSMGATPRHSDGGVFDDIRLRWGEVQEIIYPDDKRSRSGKVTEYNVFVQHRSNGTGAGAMYTNCVPQSLFGGLADYVDFTYRAPKTPSTQDKEAKGIGLGSKVLILCANGERNNAYIIGGMRDFKAKDDKAKDLGHHYLAVFNGVSASVNKDGELTVTYGGKTKIDGKKDDDAKDEEVGSFVSFFKNGNITVQDKDGKNQFLVDHKNKKIVIKRDEAFELGDATDKMLLGESFRDAQKQMNQKTQKLIDNASQQMQQGATALTTASGKIMGPFMSAAAAADFAQAGAFLLAASQLLKQASEAIGQFEQSASQKDSFLSRKNKAD